MTEYLTNLIPFKMILYCSLRKHPNAKVAMMSKMVFDTWKKSFQAEAAAAAAQKLTSG